ncbi:MAG: helix-turn-helix domain-containing protein [bacterium]
MHRCEILLVDDDRRFREELSEYLEEYRILQASSGEEALRLLQEPHEIELVMLDVKLPGLNGIEVLKRMKMMVPDLKIIILTGYSTKDIAIGALKGHADDYIEKPLQIRNTKRIIARILESRWGQQEGDSEDIKGKVERIKRFLEKNYDKKVDLRMASDRVFLSQKYLSRVFKQHTGIGFNEYRLKVKMDAAKGFLLEGGYNINQLAFKLGYENTESFIRSFKKFTGCTPSTYRKREALKYSNGLNVPQPG